MIKVRKENKIASIVREVLKDYKDPTEGMTLRQKQKFHEAMKKEVNKHKQY